MLITQKSHKEARYFMHPIINGYVLIRSMSSYDSDLDFVIISRKEHKRSGMRFLVRGIDKNGNVANFAETEQYVIHKKSKSNLDVKEFTVDFISYLQIRGSIPLFWTQQPNLQLNPSISFDQKDRENYNSFDKHVQHITKDYGKVVFIDLIDKKGDQNNIGEFLNVLHKEYKETNSIFNSRF